MNLTAITLLLAAICLPMKATGASVNVTIVTNGVGSGTVTGGGTYAAGATATIEMRATNAYYIKDITATFQGWSPANWQPNGFNSQQFGIEIPAFQSGKAPDFTVITNDTETIPSMTGDTTFVVTFASSSPVFLELPTNQVVVTGSTITFAGTATGRQPIGFQWQKDGTAIAGATNSAKSTSIPDSIESDLVISNVQPSSSGAYALSIRDEFGTSNSVSAVLLVKDILFFLNDQVITNSSVLAGPSDVILLQSPYTNASIFYTLDGSDPGFSSARYLGPFPVSLSVTIRAIAYSSDFSQSVISDSLKVELVPAYPLFVDYENHGTINLDPPYAPYLSNSLVTVTAVADPGWTFMGWTEDLSSGGATNTIVMNGPRHIKALFGTTLTTTTAGSGTVTVSPPLALYPANSSVTLTAIPGPSNYFGIWGNAASGTQNPLSTTITEANATISALFAPLPSNMVTLTLLAEGGGIAYLMGQSTNVDPVGITNRIQAIPSAGQQFLGWSGDATGTNPQTSVVMDSSKVITAHFTHNVSLSIIPFNSPEFMAIGVPGDVYQFEGSRNLLDWEPIVMITNYPVPMSFSDPNSYLFQSRVYRVDRR